MQVIKIIEDLLSEIKFDSCLKSIDSKIFENRVINLLAIGKSAAYDTQALQNFAKEKSLKINKTCVITKYNHAPSNFNKNISDSFIYHEAAHPVPNLDSLKSGKLVKDFLDNLDKDELLLVLLSGGGSSVLVLPKEEISFKLKQEITNELLKNAAKINDINLIRKSLSQIKNGGLIKLSNTKEIVCLASSDIPDNDFASIASGVTCYQELDKAYLRDLAKKYLNKSQEEYLNFLDTTDLKVNLNQNTNTKNIIVNDAINLKNKAKKVLTKYYPEKNIEFIDEIEDYDIEICKENYLSSLKNKKDHIIASVGEITLKVTKHGKGGRNTHFVLLMSKLLFKDNILNLIEDELKRIKIFSFGTDGNDGPTDAAGAYIDFNLYKKALEKNLDFELYLNNFDSYNFFKEIDSLILTGATGINLMDFRYIKV